MVTNYIQKLAGLLVTVVVLGLPTVASAQDIKFQAELTATAVDPLASGRADYSLNTTTGQRQLSVEVEDVASTTTALAYVNGRFVGTLTIVNGFADLNLDSFQGDRFPRVTTGSTCQVRRASDGALILSGSFIPGN